MAKRGAAAIWAMASSLALGCAACERRAPTSPASASAASELAGSPDGGAREAPDASAPIAVPRGCDINLSGRYHLRGRSPARYEVEDDGFHLTARALGLDASQTSAMSLWLERTPKGFVGHVLGTARTVGGRECPVAFPAALIACRAEDLVIQSADELSVDEQCQVRESPQAVTEKVLERE